MKYKGKISDDYDLVTKKYVDTAIPTVNNPTITITQKGTTMGSFTLNQDSDLTIDLNGGGEVSIVKEANDSGGQTVTITATE